MATTWAPSLPDQDDSRTATWAGEGFRAQLSDWVSSRVGDVTGMEQVKLRPWATVWRMDTEAGVFFAKQNCPLQNFEAILVDALARLVPYRIVPVAAVDPARGFLLTVDQGAVLGEAAGDDIDSWCRVVAAGAALQREVAPHAADLIDGGLTAIPPQEAPAYVAARLEALAALPDDEPRHLPPGDAEPLRALSGDIERWSDQVAGVGLPLTLNHNDLHEHNVFDTDRGLRFFDFGDALLMDPLAALLIPLRVLADKLQAAADDPRLRRVADAYLEVWTDLVPAAELRAALPAGLQLGRLGRVESWLRVSASLSPAELGEYGDSVPGWLDTLREPPPVT